MGLKNILLKPKIILLKQYTSFLNFCRNTPVHVCVPISGTEKSYGWDVEEVIHTHCILVSAQSQKWALGLILFGFDWDLPGTWGLELGLGLDNFL